VGGPLIIIDGSSRLDLTGSEVVILISSFDLLSSYPVKFTQTISVKLSLVWQAMRE